MTLLTRKMRRYVVRFLRVSKARTCCHNYVLRLNLLIL
nr:MAG TPA: hypothetical protein [Caudoviricetes sp.]